MPDEASATFGFAGVTIDFIGCCLSSYASTTQAQGETILATGKTVELSFIAATG
jgi:hypothetical protein